MQIQNFLRLWPCRTVSCTGRVPAPIWHGPGAGQLAPERITVKQLAQFDDPHLIFGNRYITHAKIKNVIPNQSWWYMACAQCNKTTQPHGDKYKCNGPACSCTEGAPRYRLPIIAVDPEPPLPGETPSAIELVFFGSTAEEIIGVPVHSLITSDGGVGSFLPTRITALYGKVFQLCVSVSTASLQKIGITYQVDGVLGGAPIPAPPLPLLQPLARQEEQPGAHEHTNVGTSSSKHHDILVGEESPPSPSMNASSSMIHPSHVALAAPKAAQIQAQETLMTSSHGTPPPMPTPPSAPPIAAHLDMASLPADKVQAKKSQITLTQNTPPISQVSDTKNRQLKRPLDAEALGDKDQSTSRDGADTATSHVRKRLNLDDCVNEA